MATPDIIPLVDDGLGNSAYLADLGDGRALAVDVSLDLREAERVAERRGLAIAFAADTHLHADFVSGARQLAATRGARILASAEGHREFTHTGLRDGDEVDLGGLRLRAITTPGHTFEHISFLLLDGDRPAGIFSGGSLIVGAAARTDLVSPDKTEELSRLQYASLRRIAELPDDLEVWPTHGTGSFCAAASGDERTTTIGREKARNPLLQAADEDEFVRRLVDPLGSFPSYFLRLAEVNRQGPAVLDLPPVLPPLDVAGVRSLVDDGAQIVDVRPTERFAARHIPGSLSIALRPVFAPWLGWLVAPETPLVIIRDEDQDPAEIAWQAIKIGYTNLVGELAGGVQAWERSGEPVSNIRVVPPDQANSGRVIDVRQTAEFAEGHLPGAVHIELGSLPDHADDLSREPTLVMCGSGLRATTAASVLESAGHRDLTILDGSAQEWADATGRRLDTGT